MTKPGQVLAHDIFFFSVIFFFSIKKTPNTSVVAKVKSEERVEVWK